MRSVSTSQVPLRAPTMPGGGAATGASFSGVAFSSTFGVQKTDSLRLPDEVIMTQPVSLGNISVVLAAGTRWVRAVATHGHTFAAPLSATEDISADCVVSTSDLAGTISCMHAVSLGGAGTTAKALGVLGTSHGTVRFFVVEVTATNAGPKIAHRVLKTLELCDASSNQLSLQDTVVSLALITTATGQPESLVVASRHCLLALSLRGMVDAFTKATSDLRATVGVAATRAHCSIHNEAPIVRVLPLLPEQSSFGGSMAGHRTGASSGSALNSVADHCVAAVVIFEDGSLQYLLRTLGHDDAHRSQIGSDEAASWGGPASSSSSSSTAVRSQNLAVPQLQYAYRLGPRCLTMFDQCTLTSSSTRSLVVVNSASLDFDEVGDCFNVILCGVEIADTSGGGVSAGAGSNGLFSKSASTAGGGSGMFSAPSGSQYAFASQSPYATKAAWWGVVRNVVPLSTVSIPQQLGLADGAFTIASLMHDERYLEVVDDVVAQWASQATAHVSPQPPRQSTATPIDRRGFASCSPSFNHTVLFSMGCELHGAVAHTASLLAPQQVYTFASTLNGCNALGGWVSSTAPTAASDNSRPQQSNGAVVQQRFVASTGNSLHLLALTLR